MICTILINMDTAKAFFILFFYFYENEFMSIRALSTVACERYEPFSQFRNAAVIDSCCRSSFLVNLLEPCWLQLGPKNKIFFATK